MKITYDSELVSVIITAYNQEAYIEQAISSVLDQTYRKLEVIVVIDGATDRTAEIVESIIDPRISIYETTNNGVSAARNLGISVANGGYLAFLDGDDYWHASKLEKHLSHFGCNPRVGVSFSFSSYVDPFGRCMQIIQTSKLSGIDLAHQFVSNSIGNGSTSVIRRAVIEDLESNCNDKSKHFSPFSTSLEQSEDYLFWIDILRFTSWQIEGIAKLLTYYRVSPQSLSSQYTKHFKSRLKVERILRATGFISSLEDRCRARKNLHLYLARSALLRADSDRALGYLRRSSSSIKLLLTPSYQAMLVWIACDKILPSSISIKIRDLFLLIFGGYQRFVLLPIAQLRCNL